eukprot:TRINITY_DN5771_c0_g1_i1.p1 TRINITY_DN5771_c0_g1~~TRINITY_DN5771_c0_g1_i1.p1  ORF type:complete len:69 (+),score=7.72 TRINITY_DN5771_c0_g1_i1:233-439(+)
MEHIEAIIDIIGFAELPLLIRELRSHLEHQIIFYNFAPYVTVLTKAIPPGSKLPLYSMVLLEGMVYST